ncbi:MAG: hypothetical protein MK100_08225 [Phycisphaerales bacterium]|nr:hypothetical protein [Phycisphaerales bacterium]
MKYACIIWGAIGCICFAGGCASSSHSAHIAPHLDILLETEDGRSVRYDVSEDGTLRFAGGRDARNSDWSWTGHLDAAQGKRLQSLIQEGKWLETTPHGIAGDGTRWEISVREGGRRKNFRIDGEVPTVRAAWGILEDAGRARLQEDLDRLPRPDMDQYMRRRHIEQSDGDDS